MSSAVAVIPGAQKPKCMREYMRISSTGEHGHSVAQ